jgi:hypothetical protein
MRSRVRGEEIRRFILTHVEKHPGDITKLVAERFQVTRQAASKHLRRLVNEKSLAQAGATRKRTYRLTPLVEWRKTYNITPELEEYILWEQDISPVLRPLPENVLDIWHYGFTEMLNNAKDHSGGSMIAVKIVKTAVSAEMMIFDNGVGIFKKIQQAFNLPDQRYAIFELTKGKLTTDPARHTGEGIFFSSRMFDRFSIAADQTYYGHRFGEDSDWVMEWGQAGTSVFMEIGNHTSRTIQKIFDEYASKHDDYGFNKTVVPVRLAQFGNDKLISRSQAQRVVARLELFQTIVLDFTGVPTIGQAFADEIFRVFSRQHPELTILPIHANSEVRRMIERAKHAAPSSPVSGREGQNAR